MGRSIPKSREREMMGGYSYSSSMDGDLIIIHDRGNLDTATHYYIKINTR